MRPLHVVLAMTSEAQNRASAKYRKENVKQVILRFYPKDHDVYEFLKSKPKVSRYLIELIRKEMPR